MAASWRGWALPALAWCGVVATMVSSAAGPHVIFRIPTPRVAESSSLVASTAHPGLLYTANDSGDGPFVYVINSSGRLVGTTTLGGVDAVDVEAMSIGSDGTLVVGDIGDNDASRDSIELYRIPQPTPGDHVVTPHRVRLRYADGPRNAESLLYDASSGRALVVSKEIFAHIYSTPPDVFARASAVLRPISIAPPIATDATFLPGGGAAVIRTYGDATVYRYPSWRPVDTFELPAQKQGESIASIPHRAAVLAGSEGADSPVWLIPLGPQAARLVDTNRGTGDVPNATATGPTSGTPSGAAARPPSASATPATPATPAHHSSGRAVVRLGALGVLIIAGLAVGIGVLTHRRRRA